MTPLVFDDVLTDPVAYRAAVLAMPRQSHTLAEGVTFHGIGQIPDRSLLDWIEARFPTLETRLSMTRLSPEGQIEPNFIHTDRHWPGWTADWTGIFYLTPDPPSTDGSTFWRHKETGADLSPAETQDEALSEGEAWQDTERWEPTRTIPAAFNRLILFPSAAYHSRALFHNYGTEPQTARLIQLAFGIGELP